MALALAMRALPGSWLSCPRPPRQHPAPPGSTSPSSPLPTVAPSPGRLGHISKTLIVLLVVIISMFDYKLLRDAMAAGEVSKPWARKFAAWNDRLRADQVGAADKILLDAARAGL